MKKFYNNVIFFKDNAYDIRDYYLEYVSRAQSFSNINGFLLDSNIYYDENNSKFILYYDLMDFKSIRIGDSKKFYMPDWISELYIKSNGLVDGYGEFYDKEDANEFHSIIPGTYYLKKIDSKRRAILMNNIIIKDITTLETVETLFDTLYDAKKIKIKSSLFKADIYDLRGHIIIEIFRLLQRPKYSKFDISIELHPSQIANFFSHDFAFLKSSTWPERQFMLELEPIELLISSKFFYPNDILYKPCKNNNNITGYNSAKENLLKMDGISKYKQIYNDANKEICLYYHTHKPIFILKFLED